MFSKQKTVTPPSMPPRIKQPTTLPPSPEAKKRIDKLKRDADAIGQILTSKFNWIRNEDATPTQELAQEMRAAAEVINRRFDWNAMQSDGIALARTYECLLENADRMEDKHVDPGSNKDEGTTDIAEGDGDAVPDEQRGLSQPLRAGRAARRKQKVEEKTG